MEYWEQYRKASFRGLEFWPLDGDDEHGRRLVAHEYPLRDKAYTEDLGKKAGVFSLRGRIVGDDFLADAQRLIEACNQPGPGALVHPLLGVLRVVCRDCRANWTLTRKGLVEFAFTFVEEGENRYPAANDDYAEIAAERAEASLVTFAGMWGEVVNVSGPGWLSDAVIADVKAAFSLLSQVVSVAAPGGGAAQALDIVAQAQAALANASSSTATDVAQIVGEGLGAIDSLAEYAGAGAALWAALEVANFGSVSEASEYGGSLAAISSTTATRETQASNRQALTDLVQRLAVTHGIKAGLAMEVESYQEAVRLRDQLVERLDALMLQAGDAGDDDAYRALAQLQADVVEAFAQKGSGLPHIASAKVPNAVTSGLAMAYALYADAARADEVLARNSSVMHPGFLPSGDELEVLRA